jgi:enamine deaminase RidA (YjgF/YER057c/UK114 family)
MEKIKKKCINPNNLFNSQQFGFSQIVVAGTGKNVFISGQVAWDENFKIIGKGDLAIQTDKSLANLAAAINLAGGTLDDIVMLRIYIVNYKKEDGSVINKGLKKYFGTLSPPSSTWLSVQGLADEDFLIEIEAQAVI